MKFEHLVEELKEKLVMLSLVKEVEILENDTFQSKRYVYIYINDEMTLRVLYNEDREELYRITNYRTGIEVDHRFAEIILQQLHYWIGELLNE